MSGSLIVNSSGTGNNVNNNGSFTNQFTSIVTEPSTSEDKSTTQTDTFDPFQTIVNGSNTTTQQTNTSNNTPASKIEQQKQDPQLTKILGSSELIRLYELKLSGKTKDGERDLDEAIKAERDKVGVNNGDINKYIEYKRTILESLGQTSETPEKVAAALDQINSLPEDLKKSINEQLKIKLADSSAIAKSAYNVDQVLDGDYAGILKANPEIAKSISKSLKTLSSDEAFTTKLSSVEEKVNEEETHNKAVAKATAWGLLGTGVGMTTLGAGSTIVGATALANFWNPVGWVLGAGLLFAGGAYVLNTDNPVKESVANFWSAATDYS